ncbi:uncharacterized protein LOC127852757 isoform X4 [Dreissena polymorpha]|uniref:Uncharacterized protein n=1 Tax=Dreissena polymorpha TaxID=45954 RepID=A0A9D4NBP0_DREPO|nr:uncharacterized protein LOC127852757 isoform X3 [Dreissena polymorpha]XP_052242699.1 uncharacterized protein LOC127852757 isoform X4 [Dreissena polymorpha]KAH3890719.1 hypothetical protein DPMN_014807 [Dreissena polymorpha]
MKRSPCAVITKSGLNDVDIDLAAQFAYLGNRKFSSDGIMEAEFVGNYLGRSILTKGTTGLGVIQKPLREKYFAYRKSPDNKPGPEVGIRVNPRGLTVLMPGSRPGQDNDEFYDLSSIHFIEAVRLVTLKQKDKKFYGAFIPIREDPAAIQDKLYVQIEKKYDHLTKMPHPPILACIMRRPSGVKAVDCHMFLIPVIEDALQLADIIHRFQDRPPNPDAYYSGQPLNERSDFSPRGPDLNTKNLGRGEPPKVDTGGYEIYRGGGRGFELRQEHFRGGDHRPQERPKSEEPNRSFERERRSSDYAYPQRDPRDFGFPGLGPGAPDRKQSREYSRPDGGYVEQDSFGEEHEFDNRISNTRERFTDNRSFEEPRMGQPRIGGLSPRNDYTDRPGGGLSPRVEYQGGMQRPPDNYLGMGRPGDRQMPAWQAPPPGREGYRGDPKDYNAAPFSRPYGPPPVSRSPPVSPMAQSSSRPLSQDEEIFSASNLESRLETEASGKPVAKVPPSRQGVRVLPSLPIKDALTQLKPVPKKIDNTHDDSMKRDSKPPSYNFNTDAQEPFLDENPYDNAPDNHNLRPKRVLSEKSPTVERRENGARTETGGKLHSDDYSHAYNPRPANNMQWSYNDEREKYMNDRNSSRTAFQSGNSESTPKNEYSPEFVRKSANPKDLEIEEMFSYLDVGDSNRDDGDFEQSLGYLP